MITWMQRHKKYLVITIWISVIAFVGAGFVGWGSVDLNTSRSNYVAKVGNLGITHKEFQNKYSELFSIQSQLSDGELTQEQALKLGLDKQALITLVRNKLLLNFAYDLGLYASDEEVLQSLMNNEYFHKDENNKIFDKEKYNLFLKNINLKASEFEESIKNDIVIQKLINLLKIPNNSEELNLITASLFMQDEINMKIITTEKVIPNENEIKEYWNKHKDNYKSEITKTFSVYTIEPEVNLNDSEIKEYWENNKNNYKDEDGKIKDFNDVIEQVKNDLGLEKTEKVAKIKYKELKNNEIKFTSTITQNLNSSFATKLNYLSENQISKPFIENNKYNIVRLDKINQSSILEYEDAKIMAKEDLEDELFKEKLQSLAKKELENNKISGENIGFISKNSKNITKLSDTEFYTFINNVFSNNEKKSFVLLNDKAIVYEIISQKLENEKELNENKIALNDEISVLKTNVILNELLIELEKIYKIKNYYKGSEL
ncbi:peptidylprolyl isomerase [Campylobacter sp. MG1]|uniref:peptidylprolyl isomerase n=1 Tax=Campylobacter sp. MG1 TaxID=2976332 RepID=UPI00226C8134|nr:peptidylprolyl isomerase [Campylobacter sp. MG1]